MFTLGGKKTPEAKQDDLVKDTTTQTFARDVVEASMKVPVIVDFWAPWCGPCRQFTPVLEKLVRAVKGKVRMVKMNIDEHPAIAGQLGVQSIPAVFAFQNGQPVDGFMGALPESQIKAFIDRLSGASDDGAGLIEAADAAFADGEIKEAAELYAALLKQDRGNADAAAGLAKCYVKTGDIKRAEQTLGLVAPDKQNVISVVSARAMLELAKKGAAAGKEDDLKAKIEKNPDDYEARFNLALALNAKGGKEDAVEQLLEIVRRDRAWKDQAAKTQLFEFFEAWGHDDQHTMTGRRRLSSILFA
ncbi:MAG: thioredoxin [Hyphomicrobiales bacterium]|nr:thioredoxin [Hyphomicrobiales bacterium]